MTGGYGADGYPGQDPDAQDYDGQGYQGQGYEGQGYEGEGQGWDPRRSRDGSVWQGDQGHGSYGGQDYAPPAPARPGYGSQSHDSQSYGSQSYDSQSYGGQSYGEPGYDARPGQPGPRYPAPPGQRGGSGGAPQVPPGYDPRADRARRMNAGHDPRASGYGQGGYGEWAQEQGDSSFLPGFGQGGGDWDGRAAGPGDGYGDRRGPRPGPGQGTGYGPAQGSAAGRGPATRPPGGQSGPPGPRLREPGRAGYDGGDGRDGADLAGGRGGWDNGSGKRPRRKATRWIPRILILVIVLAVLIGGGTGGLYIYHKYQARYHPADYAGAGIPPTVMVQVQTGETASQLAPTLVQLGVVASDRAFVVAAENSTSTTGLEPGFYQLSHHMKATLAYAALLDPKNRVQTTVTIPEGKRVSQILTILAAHTKIPLAQFQAAAKQLSKLGLPSYAGTKVKLPATVKYGQIEGYLFPATYAIVPHETALQVLQAMVARYNVEAQHINIAAAARSVHLTPAQLIIEASMVQAEAGVNADMPKMARVIINRQQRGMPGGFSSVDFYGLSKYGINLTNSAEAQASGPYDNTQKPGLPPTPIDNPGDAAIQAVLHPAPGPWLYFVTTAVGKPTHFSATCFQGTCG